MAKIITRVVGGVGNQLFCYAAARRLALVNNAELVLDDISGFVRDHKYQRHYQLDHFNIPCRKATPTERLEPLSRLRRYIMRKISRWQPLQARSYIQQEGLDFDARLLAVKPGGTLHLEGYWQSEMYFNDVESTIRDDLRIIPPDDETNLAMAQHIQECRAVAVHIRFFDMPHVHGVNNASDNYYTRAFARMESLVPAAHYFVFSDKPGFARKRVPFPAERVTMVSHNQGDENACADLWLMTQCQHFIIANSTFSWWGAWLARSENKIVFAPDPLLMDEGNFWRARGMLPENWISL